MTQVDKELQHSHSTLEESEDISLYAAISPLKIANLHVGIWIPCNTWFLGPTQPHPKWHLDGFSHFCTAHSRESLYYKIRYVHHTTPQPFDGPFSGTTWVSRCQKRTSGLYGARED